MSAQRQETVRRLSAPDIAARKGAEPIVCLTAYTAPVAEILDDHCDLLLVGDSVGMVVHGLPNTVGVTLEMMILHGQAVMRGARRAMVVIDLPFGAYEASPEVAYANAARVMKETGAQGVKGDTGPTGAALPSGCGPAAGTTGCEGRNGARCARTATGPTPGPPPPWGMQKVLCRFRWLTSAPKRPGRARPTMALRLAPSRYTWPPASWTAPQMSVIASSNTPWVLG